MKPILCVVILAFTLAGCAADTARLNPHVDAMFREVSPDSAVLGLAQPGLVNEVNGAFTVRRQAYYTAAALDESGSIIAGKGAVLTLDFTDHGDINVLRTDDKDVSFRAELASDGTVVRALLGSTRGTVSNGFVSFANDTFVSGTHEVLYDGPELVVGRIDAQFKKYRVRVNYRLARESR